jgi:hypothetical protein
MIVFSISGEIKNARDGTGLADGGAELVGTGQKVVSNNGFFTLTGVPAGTHSIKYTGPGYIDNVREVTITGDVNVGGVADISMSPKMLPSEWRATIKWDAEPRDLDTYVQWGGSKVCWYNRYAQGEGISGKLEHDDTNGFGPETAYLSDVGQCHGGTRECDVTYMINDYGETGTMPDKTAEVTLYNGDDVVNSWKIGDCPGSVSADKNWWHVFTIDSKDNKLKWSCKQSDSDHVHLLHIGVNESVVDYDTYVGPFPRRYFRHSRRHRRQTAANETKAVGHVTLLKRGSRRIA